MKKKAIWIVVFIVLWKSITILEIVHPLALPAPEKVVQRLFIGILEGELFFQLGQSIVIITIGLGISFVLGMVMSYLDYYYVWCKSLFELLSSMLHPLPSVAILPIVVLWFGVGTVPVFITVIHACIWSIYLNIKNAFLEVDKALIEAAKNNGATKWQLFSYVLLPTSKPSLMVALQIGWSRGWRSLISAEMIFGAISSIGGIGWYMFERRAFMDIEGLYSGVVLVIIVGIVVEEWIFRQRNEDEKEEIV